MKRIITVFFLIIISFLLQSTVFKFLALSGFIPNVMLILVVSFALMRGQKEGLLIGFFSGMLVDIFFGFSNILGVYAFLYMVIGYVNGFLNETLFSEDILLPTMLALINDLAYSLVIYTLFFLLRNRLDFLYYLENIILPEIVYTTFVMFILYRPLRAINNFLEKKDRPL